MTPTAVSENPLLQDLTINQQGVALTYLDPVVYMWFFVCLGVLSFFWITEKEPFNNIVVKRSTLLILSCISLMLFFGLYLYILTFLLGLLLIGLFFIKEDLKQIFLISSYNKKNLKIDLRQEQDENQTLIIMSENQSVYYRISIIRFFMDLGGGMRTAVEVITSKLYLASIFLVTFYYFIIVILFLTILITGQLFESQYLLRTN